MKSSAALLCLLSLFGAFAVAQTQVSNGTQSKPRLVPASAAYTLSETPSRGEPKLPVIDEKACPLSNRRDSAPDPMRTKLVKSEPLYSTWEEKRVPLATLKAGEEITIWHGVNLIREPDKVRVLRPSRADENPLLRPGEVVQGYGFRGDGTYMIWAKGVWTGDYHQQVVTKGSGCGFTDKSRCEFQIVENGIREWWVQVKTGKGVTGWVLAGKSIHDKTWSDANFGALCGND